MALSPVFVELRAATGEFMAKMGEARHEVSKLSTESSGHMKKFAAVGKAALAGIAGGAIAIGGASIHMADKFEISHAKLEQSIKSTGANFDGLAKPIGAVDARMEKLGFTNAQTEAGLANLTIALGSPAKAMKDVGLAADLARAKNIDLATASTAVARAQEGNLRALKSMGIDLPINAKGAEQLKVAQNSLKAATISYHAQLDALHKKHTVTKSDLETVRAAHVRLTFAQKQVNEAQHAGGMILDALDKKLGGQAAAAADTFAGKQERAKAMAEDLAAKLGLKLIPVLEQVISVTVSTVSWLEKHRGVALALGLVVGGVLVAAIGAFTVSLFTAGGALAFVLGPIGLVIAAVAALAFGGYELYKHWDTIWGGIKKIFGDAVGFVRRNALLIGGALMLLGGPFGAVIGLALIMATHWKAIWNDMQKVAGHIVGFVIQDVITPIAGAFLSFAGFMIDTAAHAFGWVPGLGGKLKSAAHAFDSFRTTTMSTLHTMANQAYGWGEKTGEGLGFGISTGIQIVTPKVLKQAKQLGGYAGKSVLEGAQIGSPSKITTYGGKMLAEGLIVGFTGAAGRVAAKLSGAMRGALDALHAVIAGAMTKMDARVKASQNKLSADLQARAQMASSISQQLVSTADISGAISQDTGQVGNIGTFLGGQVSQMRQFARDLGLLRKQGLSGALLQEIAAAGPVQGTALAESILGGQSGSVASLNQEQRQIQQYAGVAGHRTANAVYAKAVARDHATLERQEHLQKQMVALLQIVARNAAGRSSPAQVRRDLQKLERELGKKFGVS